MRSAYPDLSCVARRFSGGVLTLLLNRPQVRNAMSLAMVDELLASLQQAEQDSAVRIIVLRGVQGHFCAGGDIKDMAAARTQAAQQAHAALAGLSARFGQLCLAYARTPLAVLAVLEGSVMGGGFGLACVADVALAAATAHFRLPETALGLVPAQIAPFLVERLGYSEAKRLAVGGGQLSAAQALQLRLVHELHPDTAALELALQENIAHILRCAPAALAASKALIARARLAAPETLIAHAAELFATAALGSEGREGGAAFLEKRPPAWALPQA